MGNKWKPSPWLARKPKQGFRGYPAATIAFYGPTAELATKIAVAIIPNDEDKDPDILERWFSEGTDIRANIKVAEQVSDFIKKYAPKSIAMADRIIGCPHEEGIDYPTGKSCPKCPFWAGRDRFTHELIQ
jgi:hypothetical protein